MKTSFVVAFLHLFVLVTCQVVQNTTHFGTKGPDDIHIFSDYYNIPGTMGNRYQYVVFPPRGLVNYYNVTYVRVLDYNYYTAEVQKYAGKIGTGQIIISLRAPIFRGIEAKVDMYGTYNGPVPKSKA